MRYELFSATEVARKPPVSLIPKCDACGLYRTCRTPKMKPSGEGRRNILIVGEAPGKDEDLEGEPFVGASGKLLCKLCREVEINPNRDVIKTNALICRPPHNEIKDQKAIDYCRPNLIKFVQQMKPEVIILLGKTAIRSLIGWIWKDDIGETSRWVGWQIPCQRLNAWVCPTYHPSYLLRSENPVLDNYVREHLAAASRLTGRPWAETPDFQSEITILRDPDKAARMLRKMVKTGGVVAFDYETNMLKPDNPKSRIVSCAVCWNGEVTIAYPWQGEAVKATVELLVARNVEKVAANLKFEEKWTIAKLGVSVVNWRLDTMVASHVHDNRPDINSLKFQAFVQFGQEDYDSHIKPYLKANGGNEENRIKEVNLTDLLRYNGMDALLEYKLAMKQMELPTFQR